MNHRLSFWPEAEITKSLSSASQGQSYRMDAMRCAVCVEDCYFVSYLFCPESLEEENWFFS